MSASFKAPIQRLLVSLLFSCYHSLSFGNTPSDWSSTVAKLCSLSWRLGTMKGEVLNNNYFLVSHILASEQQEETIFFC